MAPAINLGTGNGSTAPNAALDPSVIDTGSATGANAAHKPVKPVVLAKTAVGLLEEEVVVANLIRKEGIDQYRGAKDDTVNIKVPALLPFRQYAWRNHDEAIVVDKLTEQTIAVKFQGNVYNAVAIDDEALDMGDFESWADILGPQVRAIGRGLERAAVRALETAPYEATIGIGTGTGKYTNYSGLVEARRLLKLMHAPDDGRILLVGTDFEANLLNDESFIKAVNSGAELAGGMLREATIGRVAGFTVVGSTEIAPDAAYAISPSAIVLATAAPSVPVGAAAGATASARGFGVRWLRDYDATHLQSRSVVNTYAGTRAVLDKIITWVDANNQEELVEGEHFARGVKLQLGATTAFKDATAGGFAEKLGLKKKAAA